MSGFDTQTDTASIFSTTDYMGKRKKISHYNHMKPNH
jgi:hypothetical protein